MTLLDPTVLAEVNVAWVTTRAAGIVALVASTASIVLGLTLAGRLAKGRGRLGDARVLHQTFGIATIVALAVHVLSLLFDPWLRPTLVELGVPFALDYRPLWTGLGIVAGYGFIVLGMSGFLRSRMGAAWKYVHRSVGLAWVLSVGHTIGSGSDTGTWWMTAITAACVVPVAVLLAMRVHAGRARSGDRPATPRATPQARADALLRAQR
ncbi:MAG: ferric reductase-like transmembrane domain-containing protein [Solirubrobacteraceae bacterium]|nr:ferric reductase-like transmembrane domain-containing protein [Solirubrobacteraceae bacterium]